MIGRSAQSVATDYAASTGEQLLWSGRPQPGRRARRAIPGLLLGLPLALISLSWLVGTRPQPTLALTLGFAVLRILFAAAGIGLVLGPLIVYRSAQRTVYAITSGGAHVIVAGVMRRIETYTGADLSHVRCVERPDGSGHLVFPSRLAGRTPDVSGGFYDVPSVRHVEQVLRSAGSRPVATLAAAPLDAAAARSARKTAVLVSVGMLGSLAFTAIFAFVILSDMRRSAPTPPRSSAPTRPPPSALPAARSATPPLGVPALPTPSPAATATATPTPTYAPPSAAAPTLARGAPGAPDPQRSARLLAHGCDLGSADACRQLGWMLSQGNGIPADRPAALARNLRGCELGSGDACSAAAFALAYGQGVAEDRAAALGVAERACGDGHHPRACAVVGDLLERRARDGDRPRALQVYRGCCISGDSGCCTSASRLGRSLL